MEVCRRIVKAKPRFPHSWGASERRAKDLIKRLLVREPVKRFGGLCKGFDDVRDHPWWRQDEDFDFSSFVRRTCVPPWLPAAASASDVEQLDVTYFGNWEPTDNGTFDTDAGFDAHAPADDGGGGGAEEEWPEF